jgi:5-methylcytosine-specific restriction protein A
MPFKPPTLRAPWQPTPQQARKIRERDNDRRRANDPARALYKSTRWRVERMQFLAEHPLCECDECQGGKLRVTAAEVVNHRRPHRGDETLFWDQANWQAMSAAHHNKRTATHDGGYGNRRRE